MAVSHKLGRETLDLRVMKMNALQKAGWTKIDAELAVVAVWTRDKLGTDF